MVVAEEVVVVSGGNGGGELVVGNALQVAPAQILGELGDCRHLV
jgi:hypothetical protein